MLVRCCPFIGSEPRSNVVGKCPSALTSRAFIWLSQLISSLQASMLRSNSKSIQSDDIRDSAVRSAGEGGVAVQRSLRAIRVDLNRRTFSTRADDTCPGRAFYPGAMCAAMRRARIASEQQASPDAHPHRCPTNIDRLAVAA